MSMYPYNPKKGQTIQSDAEGVVLERVFIGRYNLTAAQAAAADTDGILPNTELTTARSITTGFSNPPCPRALTYDCSASGVTGNVKVYGTNIKDEAITETKALNGQTVVAGVAAFKSITKIDLPAKVHTKAKQSFTKQVTEGAVTKLGTITLSMAGAALEETPVAVALEVAHEDSAAEVAALIVAALNDDDDFAAAYVAALTDTDKVQVTALVEAANDNTMALSFTDTDGTGVTMGADGNAVTGVAPDLVFIGYGDILGLPSMTSFKKVLGARLNGVLEATAPTEIADADEIEKNTLVLNSALDGTEVDILMYLDNE